MVFVLCFNIFSLANISFWFFFCSWIVPQVWCFISINVFNLFVNISIHFLNRFRENKQIKHGFPLEVVTLLQEFNYLVMCAGGVTLWEDFLGKGGPNSHHRAQCPRTLAFYLWQSSSASQLEDSLPGYGTLAWGGRRADRIWSWVIGNHSSQWPSPEGPTLCTLTTPVDICPDSWVIVSKICEKRYTVLVPMQFGDNARTTIKIFL